MTNVRRLASPIIAMLLAAATIAFLPASVAAAPWPGEQGSPSPPEELIDGIDLDLWGEGRGERDLRVGYAGNYGLELNSDIGHKSFLGYRCGAWDSSLQKYVLLGAGPVPAGLQCNLWVAVTNTTGQTIPASRASLQRHDPKVTAGSSWREAGRNSEDWQPGETYYFPTSGSPESFDEPGTWLREYRIRVWDSQAREELFPFKNLAFEYEVVPSRARAPQSGFAQITSGEVSIGWADPPFDGGTPVTGYEVYMIPVPESEFYRDAPFQYATHESWTKVCDFSGRPELQICDVPNNNVRTIEAGEYRFAIYSLNEAYPDPLSTGTMYALMTDPLTVPRLTNIPPPTIPPTVPAPTVPTTTSTSTPTQVVVVDYADAPNLVSLVNAVNYSNKLDAPVLRLYQAFFNRSPDLAGAKYWLGIRRQGYGLLQIAGFMAQGQEFANLYRGNSDSQYLTAVYANVLGRAYDQGGFDYWLVLLVTDQLNRVEVVFYVTQNVEFINNYPFTNN